MKQTQQQHIPGIVVNLLRVGGAEREHSSDMGTVWERANFHASETDFIWTKKNCPQGKIIRVQKTRAGFSSAIHSECIHIFLSPVLVTLIVYTATYCYSHNQVLVLNSHSYML